MGDFSGYNLLKQDCNWWDETLPKKFDKNSGCVFIGLYSLNIYRPLTVDAWDLGTMTYGQAARGAYSARHKCN
jgi:hypothetical protein